MSSKKKTLILLASIILLVAFFFPKDSTNCDSCIGSEMELICGITGTCVYYCFGIPYSCQQTSPTTTTPKSSLESSKSWKTYMNSEYNFSVKYPSNLLPKESDNDIYLNHVSFSNVSDEQSVSFSVSVRNTKLEDEVKFVKWQSSHSLVTLVKEENITAYGYPAVRLEYEPQRPDIGKSTAHIIVNNGKYSYSINSRVESIDQILSTFRFLDK